MDQTKLEAKLDRVIEALARLTDSLSPAGLPPEFLETRDESDVVTEKTLALHRQFEKVNDGLAEFEALFGVEHPLSQPAMSKSGHDSRLGYARLAKELGLDDVAEWKKEGRRFIPPVLTKAGSDRLDQILDEFQAKIRARIVAVPRRGQ